MKTEYHYTISRTDRIYLILFVSVLLGWELIKYIIPESKAGLVIPPGVQIREKLMTDTTVFAKNIYSAPYRSKAANTNYFSNEAPPESPILITDATVEELRQMGFSAKIAYNIRKYLDAGGQIHDGTDLLRIYGMDSIQLEKGMPYLLFPEKINPTSSYSSSKPITQHKPTFDQIDINVASREELEELPGVGPVLAERILKFRDALGGYYHVEQVKECYGMPPETYDKIAPLLFLKKQPQPIFINQIDFSTFSHPYLDRRIQKAISTYRTRHGSFKTEADLKNAFPPDTTWYTRILPYLVLTNKEEG